MRIEIDKIYIKRNKNPFDPVIKVRVLDIQEGYVKYLDNNSCSQVCRLYTFKFNFRDDGKLRRFDRLLSFFFL